MSYRPVTFPENDNTLHKTRIMRDRDRRSVIWSACRKSWEPIYHAISMLQVWWHHWTCCGWCNVLGRVRSGAASNAIYPSWIPWLVHDLQCHLCIADDMIHEWYNHVRIGASQLMSRHILWFLPFMHTLLLWCNKWCKIHMPWWHDLCTISVRSWMDVICVP